jgi:hypothetical protein
VCAIVIISATRDVKIESWNVQGLGCHKKRPVVRDAISTATASIICLQETKLQSVNRLTVLSFLCSHLSEFATVNAIGSSDGILMTWDPRLYSLSSVRHDRFSLSVALSSMLSDLSFAITNVYAPADHTLTPLFLSSSMQGNHILEVVWAPVLLMHLGGQDGITAYNIEDDEK